MGLQWKEIYANFHKAGILRACCAWTHRKRVMLQVYRVSILSPYKNDIPIKITIELVIDHY
jgi:hypothetical protein